MNLQRDMHPNKMIIFNVGYIFIRLFLGKLILKPKLLVPDINLTSNLKQNLLVLASILYHFFMDMILKIPMIRKS